MKPLIDISAALARFDVKLTEQMKVKASIVSRDQNTYVVVLAPSLTDVLEPGLAVKALPQPDLPVGDGLKPGGQQTQAMRVVVPERIGVVKAWDFEGTRVQVEFAFLNDTEGLVAIRDVVLRVGVGRDPGEFARFKQFVDVTPEIRVPSVIHRLPVIVGPKAGIWLCAELEGPFDSNIGSRDEDCLLIVGANNDFVHTGFVVHGDAVSEEVLGHIKKAVRKEKGAAAFGVPIAAAVTASISPHC